MEGEKKSLFRGTGKTSLNLLWILPFWLGLSRGHGEGKKMYLTEETSPSEEQSQSTASKARNKLIWIKCGLLCHWNPDRMSDMTEEHFKASFTGSGQAGAWKVKVRVHELGVEISSQLWKESLVVWSLYTQLPSPALQLTSHVILPQVMPVLGGWK